MSIFLNAIVVLYAKNEVQNRTSSFPVFSYKSILPGTLTGVLGTGLGATTDVAEVAAVD